MKTNLSFRNKLLQRGYSTLMLLGSVGVAAILTVGAARTSLTTAERADGIGTGTSIESINQAVGVYMYNYGQNILAGTSIPIGTGTVANTRSPTVAELIGLVGLNANYTQTARNGGSYVTSIANVPAGCTGMQCNLQATTYVNRAFTNSFGNYPGKSMEAIMSSTAGDVGFSSPDTPSVITGPNWTMPNPMGTATGVVMAVSGTGSSIFSQFVKLNDSRDPALRGGLTVQGNVTTTASVVAGGTVTSAGGIVASGNITTTGTVAAGGNITAAGSLVATGNITGAQLVATGPVTTSGQINANNGRVKIAAAAAAGWGCTEGNGTVTTDVNGKLLSCQNGVWANASGSSSQPAWTASRVGQTASWTDYFGRSFLTVQIGADGRVYPIGGMYVGEFPSASAIPKGDSDVLLMGYSCSPSGYETATVGPTYTDLALINGTGPTGWTVKGFNGCPAY